MKMITIDCTGITTREVLHDALANALGFPDWYGRNLDALFDCLTDLCEETELRLTGLDLLGDWAAGFAQVFEDAAAENPELTVIL